MSLVATILALVFLGFPVNQPVARALYGDGGATEEYASPYVGMIDWVDWSQPASEEDAQILEASGTGVFNNDRGTVNWARQDAGTIRSKGIHTPKNDGSVGYQVRSKTKMGASTIETTCTLQNFFEDADKTKASNKAWLNIHIPGAYTKDGWDDVYSSYDEDKKVGLPVGIGRAANSRARFDVSCSAQVRRPKVGSSTEDLVDLPIKGLVFADAESMSYGEYAYITPAKIDVNKPVSWHLLEQHKAPGDTTTTNIITGEQDKLYQYSGLKDRLDTTHPLKFTVPDYETNADFSEVTTFYADNANGAYIDLRGRPGNYLAGKAQYLGVYLAIGVVIGADLGDGPESYGQAGAIVQPEVTGNVITAPTTTAVAQPTATVKEAGLPFLGRKAPDLDTQFVRGIDGKSKAQWNPLIGDDRENSTSSPEPFDDEDAFEQPLLVSAQPGKVEQIIPCVSAETETATVSGWLDWNANGTFEDTERANGECHGKQASLVWNVTDKMLPAADAPNPAPSLLRLIATTEPAESFTSNSIVIGGEVEDHPVTIVRPQVSISKTIVGSDGKTIKGADGSGFTFSASGDGLTLPEKQQTTDSGTATFPLSFEELESAIRKLVVADSDNIVKDLFVTEEAKSGYAFYSAGETCKVPDKPKWADRPEAGVYAWPSSAAVSIVSRDSSVTIPVSPTSVLSCTVSNQPFGQISVTPQVADNGELQPGDQIDADLEFSGTYTCQAPQSGPFADKAVVEGTWSSRASEAWTSDPSNDPIYAGSTCTIVQEKIRKPGSGDEALPISDNPQYQWKLPLAYQDDDQVVARVAPAGEPLDNVQVINNVERAKTTQLRWTNVDSEGKALTGATFELRNNDGSSTNEITDCVSDCSGSLDQNPAPGEYELKDIALGDYQILQTKAPVGFELADPVDVVLVAENVASGKDAGMVVNERISVSLLPRLPLSGGMSTFIFTLVGFGFAGSALLVGYGALRKKVRS
ncbi:CshA/CshB family fibrillar adhesin-related protein [Arcanobacterium phocae]|uniref:CshA/CshB family fibrillar adhesin-related protein n=1 Tax=Arcanobacterium phocae TaxID=131112 RepID=UPI001C0EA790|nr:CshA/CshB family fibrillar adhesin-related protein [Arcanobacterium phocae]